MFSLAKDQESSSLERKTFWQWQFNSFQNNERKKKTKKPSPPPCLLTRKPRVPPMPLPPLSLVQSQGRTCGRLGPPFLWTVRRCLSSGVSGPVGEPGLRPLPLLSVWSQQKPSRESGLPSLLTGKKTTSRIWKEAMQEAITRYSFSSQPRWGQGRLIGILNFYL